MDEITVEKDYYPNGQIQSERSYKNGIPHGLHRVWYENGVLASEHILNNTVTEVSKFWDEKGNLLAENYIINGTGIEKCWDSVNKSWSEISWVDGKCTGRFRAYWADGTVAGDVYWIRNRQVSKKKYMEACEVDKSLPQYDDLKTGKKAVAGKKTAKRKARKSKSRQDNDVFYEKLFSEKEMIEALSWLTESSVPDRSLGECGSQEDSVELVRDFYDRGAIKVWVFDIDGKSDEEQNSGRLLIELPNYSQKREQILEKCSEIAEELGFDPESDTGQKYTLIMLD